jgi:hypothetical protein
MQVRPGKKEDGATLCDIIQASYRGEPGSSESGWTTEGHLVGRFPFILFENQVASGYSHQN